MGGESYMREAIKLAVENVKKGGGPFGAVIVKDGQIISRGINRVTELNDPTAHAEVMAIRGASAVLNDFNLTGLALFTGHGLKGLFLGPANMTQRIMDSTTNGSKKKLKPI
jgi:guanine deaminase